MFYKEEFVFELKDELEYQSGGDQKTKELVMKAPTGRHERFVCKLQQQLTKAMFNTRKLVSIEGEAKVETPEVSEEEEEQAKKDFVLMALQAGCDDLYDFKQTLYKMLCDGLCYINGPVERVKLTMALLSDIPLRDKDRLVGDYVANFISP